MSLQKYNIITLLNKVLNQTAKIRKNVEADYFCLFCNHHKRKMEINIETGEYHCWVCGVGGHSFQSLFKRLKVAPRYYVELYTIITKETPAVKHKAYDKSKEQLLYLPNEFISLAEPTPNSIKYRHAIYYCKKRGLTQEDILRYNIGYCESGEYADRIIIPSYDAECNLNFFTARDFTGNDPYRYKLPPWSKNIIGFECFINWQDKENYITIVEGSFDGIAVRKNAIPLFGKLMSEALKEALIINGVERINLMLDDDALKDTLRLYDFFRKYGISVYYIKLEKHDASELGFNRTNEIISNAKELEFSDLIALKLNK